MSTLRKQVVTADDLLGSCDLGPCELIAGELRMMTPAGRKHGVIAALLSHLLVDHVKEQDLGEVCTAEPGFVLRRDPDTVRAPDVAFIRKERLAGDPDKFFEGAPDLAVEVVSPSDQAQEVTDKAAAWLAAGAVEVWVVWPETRTITVHRAGADPQTLGEDDTLTGGDVLPGFRCRVGEVFE